MVKNTFRKDCADPIQQALLKARQRSMRVGHKPESRAEGWVDDGGEGFCSPGPRVCLCLQFLFCLIELPFKKNKFFIGDIKLLTEPFQKETLVH